MVLHKKCAVHAVRCYLRALTLFESYFYENLQIIHARNVSIYEDIKTAFNELFSIKKKLSAIRNEFPFPF